MAQRSSSPSFLEQLVCLWIRKERILHETFWTPTTALPVIPEADSLVLHREPGPAGLQLPTSAGNLKNIYLGQAHPLFPGQGRRLLQTVVPRVDIIPQSMSLYDRIYQVNQQASRSYITLKWASTADGYIAGTDADGQAVRTAITGAAVKARVHQWRARHQAIMVGRRTAAIDNPSLLTRMAPGPSPLRIVWDRHNRLPDDLALFQDGEASLLLTDYPQPRQGAVRYARPPDWKDLKRLLEWLYQAEGISSILVEGGPTLLQQFIQQGCWDEIHRMEAPSILQQGVAEPPWKERISFAGQEVIGQDCHYFTHST